MLEHYNGDSAKALQFVNTRRSQPKGTSADKNDGEETFLLFGEEERVFTTTSIVARCPVFMMFGS